MQVAINGWFVGHSTTGHGQYTHHMLEHLPRQHGDHKFLLLLPKRDGFEQWLARWPNVKVIPLPLPPLSKKWQKLWWEQIAVSRAARRLGADVLWTPYWGSPLWQPLPVVVTVHDLIPQLLPAYRGNLLHRLYTAFVGYTARRAAAVLTVSQASARDIAEHLHIPIDHIHVVYHGPNQEGQTAPDATQLAAVRHKYKLPPRFFLYLGGFDIRKNVRATLHAYRRYLDRGGDPSIRMVIAGQLPATDSAFAPDPRKIAAEQHLEGQVDFCGWVDDADKPALYALATAFLFPSLYEGFGMMLLEAMAAGTPVITSGE